MDEGNLRLANLLGFKKEVPTRSRLLAGIVKRGVLQDVDEATLKAYNLLENSFGRCLLRACLPVWCGAIDW